MALKLKKNFVMAMLMTLPLILLVGLRGATPDSQIYYGILINIDSFSLLNPVDFYLESGVEIGFGWCAFLLSFFSHSSFFLFSAFSLLNFWFLYKTSTIIRLHYSLVLLVYASSSYFFMQQFMQMRQGLAISIAAYAVFYFIEHRRFVIPIVLIMTGSLFHQSVFLFSIFAILFCVIEKLNLSKGRSFSVLCFLLIIIVSVFFKFFLLDFLVGVSARLQSYAATDKFSDSVGLISLPVIRTALILFFALYVSPRWLWFSSFFRFMFFMQSIALSTRLGFADFAILSGRLSTAFSYVEVFMLPMVIVSRFSKKTSFFICLAVFFAQLIISLGFQAPYLVELYFHPLSE